MSQLDEYIGKAETKKPEPTKDSFREEMEKVIAEREAKKQTQVVKQEPLQQTVQNEKNNMNLPPSTPSTTTAQNKTEPTTPQPPVAKPVDNTIFTRADRKALIKQRLQTIKDKGIRLRRTEKKDIENQEYDKTQRTKTIIIILAIASIIFITQIRQYLPNQAMYTIIILMGMTMFFPCGVMAGWLLLDPVMRCKIIRRTTKRNYGIVGFVGKGMKAVLKIKNFDDGLIWRDKACWVITKDKITQITKDANAINNTERVIDPGSVITLVDTVPMIYVDLDSMEPLMLHQKGREAVYPLEIGATLKAWEDNQRAKMMQLRKAQDILLYIAIICAAGAIVVGFLNLTKIESMAKDISTMKNLLYNMSQFP